MDLLSKFGKALGYPECCTESFRQGNNRKSYAGYCLCPDCEHLTQEEVEARLGRSLHLPPVWFSEGLWQYFTEAAWKREYKNAENLKKDLTTTK